jgi:hypothetical protein
MAHADRLQDILDQMTDGLWTVREAEAMYVKAGGKLDNFIEFANAHRSDCFHGDAVSGVEEEWPYPTELTTGPAAHKPEPLAPKERRQAAEAELQAKQATAAAKGRGR